MLQAPKFCAVLRDLSDNKTGGFDEFIIKRKYTTTCHHEHNEKKCKIMFSAIKDYFTIPAEIEQKYVDVKKLVNHQGDKDCETCDGTGIVYCSDRIHCHCKDCCEDFFPNNCSVDCEVSRALRKDHTFQ